MPEFRKDPITGRWVIIASERAKRPRHLSQDSAAAESLQCPFCAGNEAMTPPEIWSLRLNSTRANAPGWRVRVVPNKYPALEDLGEWRMNSKGIYQSTNGVGAHEVIIESASHRINMGTLSEEQFADVLRAYRERMRVLRNNPRWRYLLVYKNQGEHAGATLEHIHSQLIALPMIPRQAIDELDSAKRHFESTGRCIYCDIVQCEVERGERLVLDSERFVALCPFAPRFAYETWILPKNHEAAFEQSLDDDILAAARSLRDVILRLNRALDDPPFNYFIHSIPIRDAEPTHYHWHIEILPQLTRAAGFEWGSGVHMNSVAPEDAARLLRDAPL
jgi:UDPglucose--hexose-1-phosphate uridylyltransferase